MTLIFQDWLDAAWSMADYSYTPMHFTGTVSPQLQIILSIGFRRFPVCDELLPIFVSLRPWIGNRNVYYFISLYNIIYNSNEYCIFVSRFFDVTGSTQIFKFTSNNVNERIFSIIIVFLYSCRHTC